MAAELDHDVLAADTWHGMAAEAKESATAIFGGWPYPVFSRANPDTRGGDDRRAWIFYFYCAIHAVPSDPHFNYQQRRASSPPSRARMPVGLKSWESFEMAHLSFFFLSVP